MSRDFEEVGDFRGGDELPKDSAPETEPTGDIPQPENTPEKEEQPKEQEPQGGEGEAGAKESKPAGIIGKLCIVLDREAKYRGFVGKVIGHLGNKEVVSVEAENVTLMLDKSELAIEEDQVDFWIESSPPKRGRVLKIFPNNLCTIETIGQIYAQVSTFHVIGLVAEEGDALIGKTCTIIGNGKLHGKIGEVESTSGDGGYVVRLIDGDARVYFQRYEFAVLGDKVQYKVKGDVLVGVIQELSKWENASIEHAPSGKDSIDIVPTKNILKLITEDSDKDIFGQDCIVVSDDEYKGAKGEIGVVGEMLGEKYKVEINAGQIIILRKSFVVGGDRVSCKRGDGELAAGKLLRIDRESGAAYIDIKLPDPIIVPVWDVLGHADEEEQEPSEKEPEKDKDFISKSIDLVRFCISESLKGIGVDNFDNLGNSYGTSIQFCFLIVAFSNVRAKLGWSDVCALYRELWANNYTSVPANELSELEEVDALLLAAISDLLPYITSKLDSPSFVFDALLVLMNGGTSVSILRRSVESEFDEDIMSAILIGDAKVKVMYADYILNKMVLYDVSWELNARLFYERFDYISGIAGYVWGAAKGSVPNSSERIDYYNDTKYTHQMILNVNAELEQFIETI